MATTNDLKNGMVLNLDGQLWQVIWFQHHKPGKGGAVVRSKLKNIESGKTVDRTFNADVKVEAAGSASRSKTTYPPHYTALAGRRSPRLEVAHSILVIAQ